ncbi:MAG: hypothetical protein R3C05_21575 [Pirellulaceae bacterium]
MVELIQIRIRAGGAGMDEGIEKDTDEEPAKQKLRGGGTTKGSAERCQARKPERLIGKSLIQFKADKMLCIAWP